MSLYYYQDLSSLLTAINDLKTVCESLDDHLASMDGQFGALLDIMDAVSGGSYFNVNVIA